MWRGELLAFSGSAAKVRFNLLIWIKINRDRTTNTGPVISVSSNPCWLITHEIMPYRQIMRECTQPTTVTKTSQGVSVTKYTIFPNHYRLHSMSSKAGDNGGEEGGEGGRKRERQDQSEIKFFTLPQISPKNDIHFSHDSYFFPIFLFSKLPSAELPPGSEDHAGADGRKRMNTGVMETEEDEENTLLDGGKQCHRIISVRSYAARAKLDLAMFSALNNR